MIMMRTGMRSVTWKMAKRSMNKMRVMMTRFVINLHFGYLIKNITYIDFIT